MVASSKFAPDDRVRLSALGCERSPKIRGQAGTVLKVRGHQCDVLFDGNKTFTTLHETYLEPLQDQQ